MEIIYKTDLHNCSQYFALFESTGWNVDYKLTKEELFASISKSHSTISAFSTEKLIGFGRIVSDGILHAMIYDVIVSPEYQRQKVGSNILSRLVNICLENNIRDIQLFCAKGKRMFYEKNGFISRPNDGPGMEYKKHI